MMLQNRIKIINIFTLCLLLIFFIGIIILLNFPQVFNNTFKINHIVIEGSKKSDETKIKNNIREFSLNLINFEISDLKEHVESYEWVKRVSIKKIFPSTVIINIVENDPYAIYLNEGKSYLIDLDGSIITEVNLDKYDKKLLFVRGQESKNFLDPLIRNLTIHFPDLIPKITEIDYIEKRRWNIKLKNKLLIKLPDENIKKALINLKKLFVDQKVMQSNIIEIDLRVQGRASLKVLDGKISRTIDEI